MFFPILAYTGIVSGSLMLVFVIAAALYYISEQLEEHTVMAKRYILRYIYFVLAAHMLLWLGDGLPFWYTVLSLLTNYVYLTVMHQFPVVKFTSPQFILGCIGAVTSHLAWFSYFTRQDLPPHSIYERVPTYEGRTLPPFSQIASFFGLLIWTVPFLLFLSLSANDNVLPMTADALDGSAAHSKLHRKGLARSVLDSVWSWAAETARALGYDIQGPDSALPA